MMFIVCLFLFAAQTFGETTTHKPHSTHAHVTHPHVTHPHGHPGGTTQEPYVTDTLAFKYDPQTHMMAATTDKKCYIYSMSATESTDVHTMHGLHSLETKLINMVDDTTKTYAQMSHDDVNAASNLLAKTCNAAGWTSFKLN